MTQNNRKYKIRANMEKIPGERKNTYIYVYKDYTYYLDYRYSDTYRCTKRSSTACKGLLVQENGNFILHHSHNHPREHYVLDIFNLKNKMIRMCKETTATNKEIFDTVSRTNPKIAAKLSFTAIRALLSRERMKVHSPIPSNVRDIGNMLKNNESVKSAYKGCVTSEDNKCSTYRADMEKIPGKRKNSYIYVYEDYTYYLDFRYCDTYRCTKRSSTACKGLLVQKNENFILEHSHNHPSTPYTFDILRLKTEMIGMCKETTATNKEIFDTVSRKNPKAASYISYNAMRNILSREKLKLRPSLPLCMSDFDNLLQNHELIKSIYKGCVTSEDNKCCYIFTSDKLLKILEQSSEIFIDGTFSIVPKTPNFAQLFSIHVRYMNKGIAVLFVLCEARTQLVYKSIWKEVVKLVPDLQCNLRFIMCDYEKASMNAVQEQFPHATLCGCWFHYCQAVLKKWKRLELLKAPRKIVSMAMTLALAPSEMFSEGLNLMQMIADKESDDYPNMLHFMKYMRNTWWPISEKISVYGCPIRTNNLVESFHNIMSQKMQTVHPNLWIFLENISKLITDQEINYDRLINGLQVSRNHSHFDKCRDTKIKEAQRNLSTGIYSLKEFLQIFGEDIECQQYNITLLIADDDEDEICADLHTGGAVEADNCINNTQHNIRRRRSRKQRCNNDTNDTNDTNETNEFEAGTVEIENRENNNAEKNSDNGEIIYEIHFDNCDEGETPFVYVRIS